MTIPTEADMPELDRLQQLHWRARETLMACDPAQDPGRLALEAHDYAHAAACKVRESAGLYGWAVIRDRDAQRGDAASQSHRRYLAKSWGSALRDVRQASQAACALWGDDEARGTWPTWTDSARVWCRAAAFARTHAAQAWAAAVSAQAVQLTCWAEDSIRHRAGPIPGDVHPECRDGDERAVLDVADRAATMTAVWAAATFHPLGEIDRFRGRPDGGLGTGEQIIGKAAASVAQAARAARLWWRVAETLTETAQRSAELTGGAHDPEGLAFVRDRSAAVRDGGPAQREVQG